MPSRFIRVEVDSIESRMRPFRFSFARSSSRAERFPAAMSAICSEVIASASARLSSRVPRYTPICPVSVYCDTNE